MTRDAIFDEKTALLWISSSQNSSNTQNFATAKASRSKSIAETQKLEPQLKTQVQDQKVQIIKELHLLHIF